MTCDRHGALRMHRMNRFNCAAIARTTPARLEDAVAMTHEAATNSSATAKPQDTTAVPASLSVTL